MEEDLYKIGRIILTRKAHRIIGRHDLDADSSLSIKDESMSLSLTLTKIVVYSVKAMH